MYICVYIYIYIYNLVEAGRPQPGPSGGIQYTIQYNTIQHNTLLYYILYHTIVILYCN